MVVFTNSAGTLRADEVTRYYHLTWHEGDRPDALIAEMFETILQQMEQTGWGRILVNQQRMNPASTEAQSWFRHEWLPRAANSLRCGQAAVVLAQELFTQLDTVSLLQDTDLTIESFRSLTYRLFRHEQQAVAWLLTTPEQRSNSALLKQYHVIG